MIITLRRRRLQFSVTAMFWGTTVLCLVLLALSQSMTVSRLESEVEKLALENQSLVAGNVRLMSDRVARHPELLGLGSGSGKDSSP